MGEPAFANPMLDAVTRPPPRRVAVIGAGTIGPDIGYYLKSALPAARLFARAFGKVACTAAAREGISGFVEHRRADFSRTG